MSGCVVAPVVPGPGNAWTYRSFAPSGAPRWNDASVWNV